MDYKSCEEAYQMQLFGFSTQTICDYVNNIVMGNMEFATASLQECMFQNLKCPRASIKAATDKLMKYTTAVAEEQMKPLPSIVGEFFSLPPHILLPEDTPQRTQYTQEQEMQLKREIEELKDRANRACFLEAYFTKEAELQEKLLTSLSEYKELENAYHKIELPQQNLHSKVTEITEMTKAISDTEGACSAFSESTANNECDIPTEIRFEKVGCVTDTESTANNECDIATEIRFDKVGCVTDTESTANNECDIATEISFEKVGCVTDTEMAE